MRGYLLDSIDEIAVSCGLPTAAIFFRNAWQGGQVPPAKKNRGRNPIHSTQRRGTTPRCGEGSDVLCNREHPSGPRSGFHKSDNLRILTYSLWQHMPDATIVKVSSKGLITLPKKIRSQLGIHEGDYLTISSESDRIIFRKARIEIDYENPDDAWKAYSARRLADE